MLLLGDGMCKLGGGVVGDVIVCDGFVVNLDKAGMLVECRIRDMISLPYLEAHQKARKINDLELFGIKNPK